MICVAPLPSAASMSAGREKNIAMVCPKPDAGAPKSASPATARLSSPPRCGSRTISSTSSAVTTPTDPSTMNASRQL